jgi:hypothetical protein
VPVRRISGAAGLGAELPVMMVLPVADVLMAYYEVYIQSLG